MKDSSGKNVQTDMYAKPVRAQMPKDCYGHGANKYEPGVAPVGGFHSVFDFSGRSGDYKNSPVSKPEKPFFKG